MIRVGILGLGKTGREIAKVLLEQEDIMLVSAVVSPGSEKCGKDLGDILSCGKTGIEIEGSEKLEQIIFKTKPDVVVDFSTPSATLRNARIFSKMKVNIVIGTTGFSRLALGKLLVMTHKYHNGIVYVPNITLGVNVLMLITNLAANILNNYDFQITEIHHKHKKDSPSGTALKIKREIEKGLISSGAECLPGSIPITSVRAGGVVGKHEVMIIGEDDRIEISHETLSRRAFALGAIRAIKFIEGKTGYFEMNDVLNLKKVLGDYLDNQEHAPGKRLVHKSSAFSEPGEIFAL
jgi:4-hydroxy-tetrahydrodipicolinate reductase